ELLAVASGELRTVIAAKLKSRGHVSRFPEFRLEAFSQRGQDSRGLLALAHRGGKGDAVATVDDERDRRQALLSRPGRRQVARPAPVRVGYCDMASRGGLLAAGCRLKGQPPGLCQRPDTPM